MEEDMANIWKLLPQELIEYIAVSYLTPQEGLKLSGTWKFLSKVIAVLPAIHLVDNWERQGSTLSGDIPRRYASIPTLLQSYCRSITLSCHWWDQGWGNRKGQLYIVQSSSQNEANNSNRFDGGTVVWASPIAGHVGERLQTTFVPELGEKYSLWFKVGGGGGHKLFMNNCKIYTLINNRSLCRHYHNLHEQLHFLDHFGDMMGLHETNRQQDYHHPLSNFFPRLLLTNIQTLLYHQQHEQQQDQDPVQPTGATTTSHNQQQQNEQAITTTAAPATVTTVTTTTTAATMTEYATTTIAKFLESHNISLRGTTSLLLLNKILQDYLENITVFEDQFQTNNSYDGGGSQSDGDPSGDSSGGDSFADYSSGDSSDGYYFLW